MDGIPSSIMQRKLSFTDGDPYTLGYTNYLEVVCPFEVGTGPWFEWHAGKQDAIAEKCR